MMTTPPTPTTTISAPLCGENCNLTIVLTSYNESGFYQWDSTNWGIGDYPDDCTCTLNVQVILI